MTTTAILLTALACLLAGVVAGFFFGKIYQQGRLQADLLPRQEVERDYVPKATYTTTAAQAQQYEKRWQESLTVERDLAARLAESNAHLLHLQEKLDNHEGELKRLQAQAQLTFENLANRLLEEKSARFASTNKEQIDSLLQPVKTQLENFSKQVREMYIDETRERSSLKEQLEQLRQLNQQLSTDANQLALALKGSSKTQGDWGEIQLERLLEKAGLQNNVHYRTQSSFRNEDGRQKRPDFIILLPDNRHLIIDCKVSLTDYDRYSQSTDSQEQARHLKAHIDSLRRHIKDLSNQNYQQLYQLNSPDYLLLFVPIEPAYQLAVQHDDKLFADAFDQNIVLVTASTLLATMRTVSYIWKQEKQKRSVQEIARQSGKLYDKLVGFTNDLLQIGQRLDQAQSSYHEAMKKLKEGKKGSTLIGQAERLRQLGADTSKTLHPSLLDAGDEEEEESREEETV